MNHLSALVGAVTSRFPAFTATSLITIPLIKSPASFRLSHISHWASGSLLSLSHTSLGCPTNPVIHDGFSSSAILFHANFSLSIKSNPMVSSSSHGFPLYLCALHSPSPTLTLDINCCIKYNGAVAFELVFFIFIFFPNLSLGLPW